MPARGAVGASLNPVTDDTASTELERDDAVEGRVFTEGIAQEVTREGDLTRVTLTCMPGAPVPGSTSGPAAKIRLPEPVTVPAGGFIAIDITWLSDQDRADTSQPVQVQSETTLAGFTLSRQSLVAESTLHDGDMLSGQFMSRVPYYR